MAYTIISQNNTTTTLADENGNVITVPARVTLATSTDYTIIKVNNNSVDLEDGDGKIIRGVPACVVLAGEGGGSGDEYLPLAGGTMTGDIAFSKTGYNDKVVGNHNGDLRIGTSTTPGYDDLFISTGSGGARSISFGNGNGGKLGSSAAKFERTYTQKLNNGADITVPTTGGTMAVIGVNTTATLAAGSANWTNNEQTVNVTGITANGVVLVSPTPANQSAYTSAGILCTSQAAGSLTFTCDTVPSADITVTVVML